jgi:hypothetical protein
MIRRYAIGLLALVAIGFVAAPAEAGGGNAGTKRSVSIKTSNLTAGDVCVFGMTEKQATANPPVLPKSVKDAQKNFGGVVIPAGKAKTVKVPAGKGVLGAFDVGNVLDPGGAAYNLNNGASTTARVGEDAGKLVVLIP